MSTFDEDDWHNLLDRIANRHVLPLLGPAMVCVEAASEPVYQALAAPLAAKLGLQGADWQNTSQVARTAISQGRASSVQVWDKLKPMLKALQQPSAGLRALAAIDSFDLYLSSTPDALLAIALQDAGRGFDNFRCNFQHWSATYA